MNAAVGPRRPYWVAYPVGSFLRRRAVVSRGDLERERFWHTFSFSCAQCWCGGTAFESGCSGMAPMSRVFLTSCEAWGREAGLVPFLLSPACSAGGVALPSEAVASGMALMSRWEER